ncbi:MAG: DUF4252 domain-containing protein [Bacteroidales bacterium]|nr:DUF4252 domain-containing protein [Bacteroidales bacterium]
MLKIIFPVLIFYSLSAAGQSKSIDRFRKEFKEDNNVFIYSSTLKMLNTEENPEFDDLVKDIEEIRVLNYIKANQHFKADPITGLKKNLTDELYKELMTFTDQGNKILLYGKEKRGKTVGLVALIENKEKFTIIDVAGNIDFNKFLQLKKRLDTKL